MTETVLVAVLCLVAMLRVFFLCAAFPVFNPVDEIQHFDTVVRYADGTASGAGKSIKGLDLWTARMQIVYGSPEYLHPELKDTLPTFQKMDRPEADTIVDSLRQKVADSLPNFEIHSPPLYYAVAGEWLNLGKLLFSNDGLVVYWVRFLNVLCCGLLVWGSYYTCRFYFPDSASFRLGIPMLVAVLPNSIFYCINSDVFSPLFCLAALYLSVQICLGRHGVWYNALTGLAVASTILVKLTNLPVFTVCLGIVAFGLVRDLNDGALKTRISHFGMFFLGFIAPIGWWLARNISLGGDLLGTTGKVAYLGWTRKPFVEWFNHPLFSLSGLGTTLDNFNMLAYTLWRGELVKWPDPFDLFFSLSSLLLVGLGVIKLFKERQGPLDVRRLVGLSSLAAVALSLLFIVFSSIQFDFGTCFSPSRANPFFNKGRLILGCLLPFLVLYIEGLEYLFASLRVRLHPLWFISAGCLVLLVATPLVCSGIFSSSWNWYHLPG